MNQEQKQSPEQNRSASQRIADLENAVMNLFNLNDNLIKDLNTCKGALKLLNNKVSSIVKASTDGEDITDEVLDRLMIESNCEELAQRVANMVTQGVVAKEDVVSENSFVVGSELDNDDKVVNPRLQFALKALSPELQAKLLGSKSGDTLVLEKGKLKFKVLESYKIATEPAQTSSETPETTAEATTTELTQEVAPEVVVA